MTFRRLLTAGNGVHNYFWKARPAAAPATFERGELTWRPRDT